MAARDSMKLLVDRLRSVTGAATDDEFGGITYWTDDQLEAELDKHRYDARVPLTVTEYRQDGRVTYRYTFSIPRGFWTENKYTVRDDNGREVGTAYTVEVNSERGTVLFAEDIGNRRLFIDLSLIDWNAAAADVWEQKAAHRYDLITVKAGDTRFDAAQERDFCVARAAWHRARRVKGFNRVKLGFVPAAHRRPRR